MVSDLSSVAWIDLADIVVARYVCSLATSAIEPVGSKQVVVRNVSIAASTLVAQDILKLVLDVCLRPSLILTTNWMHIWVWIWRLVCSLLKISSRKMHWHHLRRSVWASCHFRWLCADRRLVYISTCVTRAATNMLLRLFLHASLVIVHVDLLLDSLWVVEDVLTVRVLRSYCTTWVHHLLAMEELHVDEWVLLILIASLRVIARTLSHVVATCASALWRDNHIWVAKLMALIIQASWGNITGSCVAQDGLSWIWTTFTRSESAHYGIDVAAETTSVWSRSMIARLLS